MRLYLVQHAQAKVEEEDPQRPLTKKGQENARKVAAYAATHLNIEVKHIMHSGKLRALQTAQIFAEHLHPPEGISEADSLEPMADPKSWANRLEYMIEDTILVGHLPHLSRLTSLLLCGDENRKTVDFQMGGIVCLTRDESGWSVRWILTAEMV